MKRDSYYYGDYDFELEKSKRGRIPPFARAALIIVLGLIVLQVVNVLTVGVTFVFFYPIQLLIYLGGGALAAHFAVRERCITNEILIHGAAAGLTLSIIEWLVYAVIIAIFGSVTIVPWFTGLVVCAVCGPVDVILATALSLLGAWLVHRVMGTKETLDEEW